MIAHPLKHGSGQPRSVTYRLSGSFTVETAPRVLEGLQELHHPDLRFISLDFTNVHEVDSSALATLLWGLHYSVQHPVQITIIGAPAKLGALMELYQLEQMFQFFHD